MVAYFLVRRRDMMKVHEIRVQLVLNEVDVEGIRKEVH